jgi:galactokinase
MELPTPLISQACTDFKKRFGAAPTALGCAPGRVELLGNHTDYNGGLVMSAAVDRFTVVVGRPVAARNGDVVALDFDSQERIELDHLVQSPPGSWQNYVKGVIWAIQEHHASPLVSGFEIVITGNVPRGAGLSSSASLQASLACFLLQAGIVPAHSIDELRGDQADQARLTWARILSRSENDYVGVSSGLLDQFSSLMGRADHALFLDCKTTEHERLPLGDPAPAIVVCDSKTSRQLADGMYNRRRRECESVVAYFQGLRGADQVHQLRDITLADLEEHWERLDPIGRRRSRHVLTENLRVQRGVEALRSGALADFGKLISSSHLSSRDDFENSSPALDSLIEAAQSAPGFLGGKLSGAGWAGCTVNLVQAELTEAFAHWVRQDHALRVGVVPDVHVCAAAEGAWGQPAG